jgi:4-hydroxy-3-methylbut-2-en-1-yl diphosphate reductase
VILPAFGVTIEVLNEMQARGCALVDTTCGSVANVWKNVRRFAQEGFTAIIHGKVHHEETQATASRAVDCPGGHYLVVADQPEAAHACAFIRDGGDPAGFLEKVGQAASAGFAPVRDLERIGLANQTTMLMSESLAIGDVFRRAMIERYGEARLDQHFRTFQTICSATQDRQDAVADLLDRRRLDLMIVLGGYNSSNTCNLARMCAGRRVPTYHIEDAGCLVSGEEIRYRPVGAAEEIAADHWLPAEGPVAFGLTAGASTPDASVEAVVRRLDVLCNAPQS